MLMRSCFCFCRYLAIVCCGRFYYMATIPINCIHRPQFTRVRKIIDVQMQALLMSVDVSIAVKCGRVSLAAVGGLLFNNHQQSYRLRHDCNGVLWIAFAKTEGWPSVCTCKYYPKHQGLIRQDDRNKIIHEHSKNGLTNRYIESI